MVVFIDDIKKKFKFCVIDKSIYNSTTQKSAVFPPLAKTSEVFCVAEVVYGVFANMATASGAVMVDGSRNKYMKCVESTTINTPSRKRKGCFGWIRFLIRKKVSTMGTNNMKYGILLTALNLQTRKVTSTSLVLFVHKRHGVVL